jgi:hypothetical protein
LTRPLDGAVLDPFLKTLAHNLRRYDALLGGWDIRVDARADGGLKEVSSLLGTAGPEFPILPTFLSFAHFDPFIRDSLDLRLALSFLHANLPLRL